MRRREEAAVAVTGERRSRAVPTATSGRSAAASRHEMATAVSASSGSERAWGSPRQRVDTKPAWPDVPWDTPRRHNLTDDQKVRTDERYDVTDGRHGGGGRSVLLASGAEDEFSSLYDDLTDDSSAVDEPIRVVIRRRVTDSGGGGGVGGDSAAAPRPAPAGRLVEVRRQPRTVTLDRCEDQECSAAASSSRRIGLTRFGDEDQEAMARPIARKSPSEPQRRDQASPRGPVPRRRSALPLAKCTLRSPLKHTSSAHAWLSGPGAVRSSGSWSSHDRLDFSGGREGRYQHGHQVAAECKAGLKESETQTGVDSWRDEPRDSHSQVLKYMVQREDLVSGHNMTPHVRKKPAAQHRLSSAGKRSGNEEGSSTSGDTGASHIQG